VPPPSRFQSFVRVEVSPEQLAELEGALNPKQVRSALFQAVKRTTKTGATQINRRVRAEININKKYADRAIRAREPSGDNPVGVISISRYPIPLIAYRPRVSKKGGARVTIGKGKPPIVYRHAYKATVKTAGTDGVHEGHEGIFLRDRHLPTKGPNADRVREWVYKGKKRKSRIKLTPRGIAGSFAMRELMGPSVLSVLGEEGTTKVAQEELAKLNGVLQKNLDSQFFRFTGTRPARPPTP
jgi:hypothetical protein